MQADLDRIHEETKRLKEVEIGSAKESRQLASQLETDLQQILDDKKAELKVCRFTVKHNRAKLGASLRVAFLDSFC